jgi:hypothetical protein
MKKQKIHTICTRSLQKNESRSEPIDPGTAAVVRVALGRAEARCPPEKEREELSRCAMVVVDGGGELGRREEAGARSGRCRQARAMQAPARCRARAGWRQCRGVGRRPALEGGGLGEAVRRQRRRPGRGGGGGRVDWIGAGIRVFGLPTDFYTLPIPGLRDGLYKSRRVFLQNQKHESPTESQGSHMGHARYR